MVRARHFGEVLSRDGHVRKALEPWNADRKDPVACVLDDLAEVRAVSPYVPDVRSVTPHTGLEPRVGRRDRRSLRLRVGLCEALRHVETRLAMMLCRPRWILRQWSEQRAFRHDRVVHAEVHAEGKRRTSELIRKVPVERLDVHRLDTVRPVAPRRAAGPAIEVDVCEGGPEVGAERLIDGPGIDRAHGRYSTPLADEGVCFRGSAVPISGRWESRPRRPHSAASSSTRRTGSVGSAKIAVPTWTATAPTAR